MIAGYTDLLNGCTFANTHRYNSRGTFGFESAVILSWEGPGEGMPFWQELRRISDAN